MLASSIRAGTTVSISESLPTHLESEGWVVSLVFHIAGKLEKQALASDSEGRWTATMQASFTENWDPGVYRVFLIAEKGDERDLIWEQDLSVLPNPISLERQQTKLEKELDLVKEAISALLAGKGVKSYRIETNVGARQLERMELSELRRHKNYLEGQVEAEAIKMGRKKRSARWRSIGIRFGS